MRINSVSALAGSHTMQMSVLEGAGSSSKIPTLAVAVETAVFAAHGGVTAAYKAKFRNLHFNLKDEKNPDLRRRVSE